MVEWLNPSTIASSVVGSIIAGVLLLTAAPIWWKWVKIADTAKFGEKVKTIKATAEITPLSERSAARQRYRAACLVNKGFEWD